MRKISDIKGEEALDVLADIMEPASEIMTDKDVVLLARAGERLRSVSTAIKNHKGAVIKILAILEMEDPEEYQPSLMSLPTKLLEVFNDPTMKQVFSLQGQTQEKNASGSATENTKETAKK